MSVQVSVESLSKCSWNGCPSARGIRNEATYQDLYEEVWTYADWAKEQGQDGRDTGIDLVAKTQGTNEYHAIQCKLYAAHIWYKCARPARWTHFRRGGVDSIF